MSLTQRAGCGWEGDAWGACLVLCECGRVLCLSMKRSSIHPAASGCRESHVRICTHGMPRTYGGFSARPMMKRPYPPSSTPTYSFFADSSSSSSNTSRLPWPFLLGGKGKSGPPESWPSVLRLPPLQHPFRHRRPCTRRQSTLLLFPPPRLLLPPLLPSAIPATPPMASPSLAPPPPPPAARAAAAVLTRPTCLRPIGASTSPPPRTVPQLDDRAFPFRVQVRRMSLCRP